MRVNIQAAVVERENFDNWLFADEPTEEARSRHLDRILRARVEAAAREHMLTDAERAKLRLAGKGDIKRFSIRSRSGGVPSRRSGRAGGPDSRPCVASTRSCRPTRKARSATARSSQDAPSDQRRPEDRPLARDGVTGRPCRIELRPAAGDHVGWFGPSARRFRAEPRHARVPAPCRRPCGTSRMAQAPAGASGTRS